MKKYIIKSSKIIASVAIGIMLINCSSDSGGSDPVVHLHLFRRQNILLLYPLAVEEL